MKNILSKTFLDFLSKLVLKIQCLYLFAKNLMQANKLRVNNVRFCEIVIIEKTQIKLLWDAKGCHKIIIEDIGTFKGNLSGIEIPVCDFGKEVVICFCGLFKQIKKRLILNTTKIDLLNSFLTISTMPIISNPENKERNLESEFGCNHLESIFNNSGLRVNLNEIYFEINSFEQENYEHLST